MKKNFVFVYGAVWIILSSLILPAQTTDVYLRPLQVERSRDFDALHYRIELDFDEERQAFQGKTMVTLKPFQDGFSKCTLDAETFQVISVSEESSQALNFEQKDGQLVIHLSRAYQRGESLSFVVIYAAENLGNPQGRRPGINFIPETPQNPRLILARSFAEGARHWFPCYDHPNDKVTQEVIATIPHNYQALSNGKLISTEEHPSGATKTVHWSQERPHATYLSTFAAGPYEVVEDSLEELPINYWAYAGWMTDALNSYNRTPEIVDFLANYYGYPFPWTKYDQIIVPGGGGAECTSATLLGQNMVHDLRGEQDFSSHGWLIVHEAAHQWWGDLVTCRDWGHTWINESFGTYSEVMFAEYESGRDDADVNLLGKKNQYLYEAYTRYMRPIVCHHWEAPGQNFDRHTYQKGAAVVHMMKWLLGEKPFKATLSHFLHKHAYQPADTHDFLTAIKEVTGQNLSWFFEQWLLSPGHPIFEVETDWDEVSKKLIWGIKQVQDVSGRVPFFRTPVILGVVTPEGKKSTKVWLEKMEEKFTFDCSQRPLMVRFDEGNYLLKEWTFKKPLQELLYQLEHDDAVGRMWAAQEIAKFDSDPQAAEALIRRAEKDSFWAVRRDILYRLGGFRGATQMDLERYNISWTRLNEGFHGGGLLTAELGSLFQRMAEDPNPKVRAAALWSLGNLKRPNDIDFLKKRFTRDDSYGAQAAALIALGKCGAGDTNVIAYLQGAAGMKSPLDIIKRAAEWALTELKVKSY